MKPIGEILSSSIIALVAESWQSEDEDGLPCCQRPGFGSFLKVESSEAGLDIFAVVYNVVTGPQDDMHKPSALKLTRQQLRVEQPHIFALLRTEIHASVVGYRQGKTYFQRLPPEPAQVHDFVYPAQKDELKAITEDLDFVRLIACVSAVPADELMAAAVRQASLARDNDYSFLIAAGQALSQLFRDDYDRLACLLRKIKPDAL